MKIGMTIIGLMAVTSTSFASNCVVTRVQTNISPAIIELKVNEIFGKNNPGKTQLNEQDAALPYALSITTSDSNQDVTVIIRQKNNRYSSAGASGAFDSKGKFEHSVIINSENGKQDILDILCNK
jgi:hypothetical protein